ncbi:acyl-CoA dehydrogenase family protein [Sphingomicrobium lutaoense]|uniref:Alkylation response protein AidB-like acyl-CoA dehydrogenase n=1 Tax=Sphingomicrobium lutaoense TaxID=515949 RepID=A0A839Z387_9SPHN|nr:acyl-CoA dehydrogenase [Sphingomicrobium lutaoense]MBB3764253.1 alkylation response protein AidB-like acyl-CoA dehydrogenase [Sphingomicrobium lutaoense]
MLKLNDDQQMLLDTVRPFMADEGRIETQLRHWRDKGCPDGFGHGLWERFGQLGLSGILIPESAGGSGLGQVEANVVLEEIGRNLTPSPFLTTAVTAVRAIEGTPHAERWFPGIVEGKTVAAIALDEGPRHDPAGTAMEARRSGNGFTLNGSKQFVVHGRSADFFIVAARSGGSAGEREGITLFAVPRDAKGLELENVTLADSSKAARLDFDEVAVDADAVIGEVDGGWNLLRRALRAGRAGAASELVGIAAGAFAMTNDYLRERKQFGREIGSFQALQHRAAHLYSEIEIARAATLKAAQLIDEEHGDAERFTAVAKAKAGSVARLAVQEAVQMHGGIGMTDEHDVGFYMKRQAVMDELFGRPSFHARHLGKD